LPSLFATIDEMRRADISASSGFGRWDTNGQARHTSWRDVAAAVADLAVWSDDGGGKRVADGRVSNSVRGVKAALCRTPGSHSNHHANRHAWARGWIRSWLVIQEAVLGSEFGSVARSFDGDLMGRVRQPIQRTIAEDWVVEQAQPFVHTPIGSDGEARSAVSLDDQLVEIVALLRRQTTQPEIIEDDQLRSCALFHLDGSRRAEFRDPNALLRNRDRAGQPGLLRLQRQPAMVPTKDRRATNPGAELQN
jgi:hypothetical protein